MAVRRLTRSVTHTDDATCPGSSGLHPLRCSHSACRECYLRVLYSIDCLSAAMVLSFSDFTPVEWLLAISVAGTFIGHGCIALGGGEPKWYSYLAVASIGPSIGRTLMPLIGALDVALGLASILYPHPAVLAYAAVWGAATAVMRPLAGESVWAAVERTGNSLPAAALMWLTAEHEQKGGGYYYALVTAVMAMMLASVTLLLRQTSVLAEGKEQPAAAKAYKSK